MSFTIFSSPTSYFFNSANSGGVSLKSTTSTINNFIVKTLSAGAGITLTESVPNNITITSSGSGAAVMSVNNYSPAPSGGVGLVNNPGMNTDIYINQLTSGAGISVTNPASGEVRIANTGVTSLSSGGSGIAILNNSTPTTPVIRSLTADTGINISLSSNDIHIGNNGVLSVLSTGSTNTLVAGTSQNPTIKTLIAGTNISITSGSTALTINSTGGGGSPSSPTNSVQFNNSGSFGGSSDLIFNSTTSRLGVQTATPLTPLHVSGTVGDTIDTPSSLTATLDVDANVDNPTTFTSGAVLGPELNSAPIVNLLELDYAAVFSGCTQNFGSGSYIASGQTINYQIYTYRLLDGIYVINPVLLSGSFTDMANDGSSFYLEVAFQSSSNSNANYDGFIINTDKGLGGGFIYGITSTNNNVIDMGDWGSPQVFDTATYPTSGITHTATSSQYKTINSTNYRSNYVSSTSGTDSGQSSWVVIIQANINTSLTNDGFYILQQNGQYQDIGTATSWNDWGQSGTLDLTYFNTISWLYVDTSILNQDYTWNTAADVTGSRPINGIQYDVLLYSYHTYNAQKFYSTTAAVFNIGTPSNNPFAINGNFNVDTGNVSGYVVLLVDQNDNSIIYAGIDIGNTNSFSGLAIQTAPDVSNKLSTFTGRTFNFDAYGYVTSPSLKYSVNSSSSIVNTGNPTQGYVFQHSLSGFGSATDMKLIEDSYRGIGNFYDDVTVSSLNQFYTVLGDAVVTPTTTGYLANGSNLNHTYRVWSYVTGSVTYYSSTFATFTTNDPNNGNYYKVNLVTSAVAGASGYKYQKVGVGYSNKSNNWFDTTSEPWSESSTVTPTIGPISAATFQKDTVDVNDLATVRYRNSSTTQSAHNSFEYTPSPGTYTEIGRYGVDSADNNFFIKSNSGLNIGDYSAYHTKLLSTQSTFNNGGSSSYIFKVTGSARPSLINADATRDCVYLGTDFSDVGNYNSASVIKSSASGQALAIVPHTSATLSSNCLTVGQTGSFTAKITNEGKAAFGTLSAVGTTNIRAGAGNSTTTSLLFENTTTLPSTPIAGGLERNDAAGRLYYTDSTNSRRAIVRDLTSSTSTFFWRSGTDGYPVADNSLFLQSPLVLAASIVFLFQSGLSVSATKDITMGDNSRLLGNFRPNYTLRTTTYNISPVDYVVDCSTNAFTVTLPTAVGCQGRMYIVLNSNTLGSGNTITVQTTSSQTIGGAAAPYLIVAASPNSSLQVVSNGANWVKI